MSNAPRDDNRIPGLVGESNAGNHLPITIWADPATHRLLVNSVVSGTVTLAGMQIPNYDYVSNTSTSTSDTYKFYTGGSGGSLVATVALVYTDSTKGTLSTVTKT